MSTSKSTSHGGEKRVIVWSQQFADRPYPLLQWHDPVTGKRKSKSAETCNPIEVEIRRSDLEYELNNNLHHEPSRLTWPKFRELFEAEQLPNVRPGTARICRITLDQFEAITKPTKISSVTERTVSEFVRGLRERKGLQGESMMPSTIVTRLRFLHGAIAWAVDQGFLDKVPKFPSVKVPRKKPQPVAAELFERLIDVVPDQQTQAFLLCGWLAGLRLVEAFELEREETTKAPWVDFDRQRIWLPAEMVKAVEDQWLPLDPQLAEALQALPRQGKKVFHFTNLRGGRHEGERVLASSLSQRIVRLARKAGVRLTVRALRRGFGCRYAGKVPAQVLQRLMRHSDIKITMDYYANVDQAVEDAVLGDRFSTRNSSRNNASIPSPESHQDD